MIVENDDDRYCPMPSHHPDQKWMVWDWDDNTAVAYNYEEEHADRVAIALNEHARRSGWKAPWKHGGGQCGEQSLLC